MLCIIESMKLMNEIESEVAGVVASKLCENGRPVEYGEALFAIRPRLNMFQKILIANRGEIALRIICASKDLGIRTVAVYSEADRYSLHTRFADEAICIGPAKSSRSYLDIPVGDQRGRDHQRGRGASGLRVSFRKRGFRGSVRDQRPDVHRAEAGGDPAHGAEADRPRGDGGSRRSHSSRIEGDSEKSRRGAGDRGADRIPGDAQSLGGRRRTRDARSAAAEELGPLQAQAQAEAAAAFSCGDLYMEKLVENPRHIEFQILADQHGNIEVLGERECSIQRRHQKLVEEAPSVAVSPELRCRISEGLKSALSDIGYTNAGTVEFLMDASGDLYFIEVNARIQVEHPVTEMVTGVDLVKSQIRIAAGERLDHILRERVTLRGHAIECRVNAEHPETFTPSPGRITGLNLPGGAGIRVDTAAYQDGVIPPYYDSLVAKLIAWGGDRDEAIARMRRALEMFVVEGIYTSIPLHERILSHPDFVAGKLDTGFLSRMGVGEKK